MDMEGVEIPLREKNADPEGSMKGSWADENNSHLSPYTSSIFHIIKEWLFLRAGHIQLLSTVVWNHLSSDVIYLQTQPNFNFLKRKAEGISKNVIKLSIFT